MSTPAPTRWSPPTDQQSADGGFTLIEVMVSLVIVTIVLTALITVFGQSVRRTSHQYSQQTAVRLVTERADAIRGQSTDAIARHTATPEDITIGGIDYAITTSSEDCYQPIGDGTDVTCMRLADIPTGAAYASVRRMTVSVEWEAVSCGSTPCTYSDTILVNIDPDSTFALNESPPAPPVLDGCSDQTVSIGEELDFDIRDARIGCSVEDGVSPFTWASDALPQGVTLAPNGRISGTVAGSPGTVHSTVTVTDAFLRNDNDNFSWTIVEPVPDFYVRNLWLRIGHDHPISVSLGNFLNDEIRGATYQIIDGELPPDLHLDEDTGVISGAATVTEPGDYHITVRATDAAGRTWDSTFFYFVRGNYPNKLLLCPVKKLPYEPPISVPLDPPKCGIPGHYNEEFSVGSDVVEFDVNQPIKPFNLWDDIYGGTSPYRFVADGAPAWVNIDPDTGVVSGTPTRVTRGGELKFIFQVYDAHDAFYARTTVRWRIVE